jgi:formylglycine-generating enzyme required for sulfatase activity
MKTLNVIVTTLLLGISIISYSQTYPEMILVEGGTFTMGDTKMEGLPWEQPSHEVTLKTFKIAKTETTVAQWRAYCNATGRSMPETPSWGWIDNHPIVNVNYSDATAYCDWLAEKMDADYRLPTEAEWEYAARGGKLSKDTKYSGGRSIDNVGWYEDNSSSKTQVVATKNPNELGIYDMSGNVWEWCKDWFGDYSATAQTNPKGPTSGSRRVVRGGSWGYLAWRCRVASRSFNDPADRYHYYGFRVLLSQ